MLQTDKSKYKPGDRVNMRLFFVHFNGRPVNNTNLRNFRIEICNRYGERIWTKSKELHFPVVYTYELNISEEAFLGNYTVLVWTNLDKDDQALNIDDAAFKRDFVVEKYVLPEYMLTVETKKVVTYSDSILLQVYATYTFGKNVTGKARVSASLNGSPFFSSDIKCDHLGETMIQFDKQLLNQNGNNQVTVNVEYEDILSLRRVSQSLSVSVLKTIEKKLTMEPSYELQQFKPGMPFSINVYLKDIDGSFVELSEDFINVDLKQSFKLMKCESDIFDSIKQSHTTLESRKTENYVAQFTVEDVPFNTSLMTFTAKYRDLKGELSIQNSFY